MQTQEIYDAIHSITYEIAKITLITTFVFVVYLITIASIFKNKEIPYGLDPINWLDIFTKI
jgi:hypothetical protein